MLVQVLIRSWIRSGFHGRGEAIWESYFKFQGRLSRTSPQLRNTMTRLVQLLRNDWHEYVSQAYQDIYYVAESFDDVKTKLRWSLSGTKSWFRSNNNRVWTASSLSRPFTVRYIPFSQTIEVLDTYCSTSNLITVDKNTFPEDSKESTYFGSSYPYNLVLGVEDPGKPTLGCFSTDFRKLNILIEESVYQFHTIS